MNRDPYMRLINSIIMAIMQKELIEDLTTASYLLKDITNFMFRTKKYIKIEDVSIQFIQKL
jgi:hypothetical protein